MNIQRKARPKSRMNLPSAGALEDCQHHVDIGQKTSILAYRQIEKDDDECIFFFDEELFLEDYRKRLGLVSLGGKSLKPRKAANMRKVRWLAVMPGSNA